MNTEISVFLGPVFLGIFTKSQECAGGRKGAPKLGDFWATKKETSWLISIPSSDVCFDCGQFIYTQLPAQKIRMKSKDFLYFRSEIVG